MHFTPSFRALLFLIVFLSCFAENISAQIPSTCAKIEAILVAACGQPEGQNEMVRFQIGNTPMNTSNLSISWATTTVAWSGVIQNSTTAANVAAINAQITGCGWVLEPTGGVLPAGAQVIIVTSYAMVPSYNSFANLQDTIYMLFHNSTNTTGHFRNYGCAGCTRTTTLTFAGAGGCTDVAVYEPDSLRTPAGVYGSGGGGCVNFNLDGTKTYFNDGCRAPFIIPKINAGNDTTFTFCSSTSDIFLHGTTIGNFNHYRWQGGHGSFSHPDSLYTTYTLSPLDVSPIQFILYGNFSCPDSIADTVNISITTPVIYPHTVSICAGSSYHIGSHTYTSPGVYSDTLINSIGCDSIVATTLVLRSPQRISLPFSGCGQLSYGGFTFTSSVVLHDTLRSVAGCDSVYYTISITIKQPTTYTQNVLVCQGQSTSIGSHSHSIPGTYIDTITNAAGCDSIVTTVFAYAGAAIHAGSNVAICHGDSTQLHATGATGTNGYTWTPTTGLSNPSSANPYAKPLVTTTYTVTSPVSVSNQIVNGDFSNGNTGFSSSYTYTNTPPGQPCGTYGILGCEGFYTINTSPSNTHTQFTSFGDHTTGTGQMMIVNGSTTANTNLWCQNITVQTNSTYQFSAWMANVDRFPQTPANVQFTINGTPVGNYFSPGSAAAGVWSQFFVTWNSGNNTSINICITDSSLATGGNDFAIDDISFAQICNGSDTVQVVVHPTYRDTVSATICRANAPYTLPNGTSVSTSGTYTSHLQSIYSCDSFVVTKLIVDTVINQTIHLSGCGQVTYNGTSYTSDAILTQTIPFVNGCDSLIKAVYVTVNNYGFNNQSPTICQGQTFIVGTKSYSSSGFYIDTLRNASASGCDSIVHTTLTVISPYNANLSLFDTCVGIFNGNSYTSTTTVRDTIHSITTGCDSVYRSVTINIIPPTVSTHTKNVRICAGQSYFAGGQNQTTPGTYLDTIFTTTGGCDSVITTTNLSILTPQHINVLFDTCNAVTLSNGITYTRDTSFTITTVSSLGCDSIIQTDSIHINTTNISVLSTAVLPILQGDSTQLIINPTGNYQNVIWSPNEWISNRYSPSPFVTPQTSTDYSVTAQDSNHCSVSGHLIVTVTPSDGIDFAMPNAFSPNGDRMNELYGPILAPNTLVTQFHIYNRWGELVFDKDLSGSNQWDGNYKNAIQPSGTYLYFITFVSASGKITNLEGNFTLLR